MTSPAFDLIGLTELRNDPRYRSIDGAIENGQNLAVAVIDTGIEGSHPLLNDNFRAFVNFAESVGSEGVVITDPTQTFDTDSHGTHVAGTVGSEDEEIGVATGVDLISLQVFNSDGGSSFQNIIEALEWVLNNRAEYNIVAVNMSLGGNFFPPSEVAQDPTAPIIDQLEQAGITIVSAAGNSYAESFANPSIPRQNVRAPAISSTLAVGAVYQEEYGPNSVDLTPDPDQIVGFSQRRQFDKMIFAPGAFINSTVPGGETEAKAGTSMSSAIVAGTVTLLQEAALQFGDRRLTTAEVRKILLQTADPINDGDDEDHQSPLEPTGEDFLRVNVYNAIQEVERRLGDVTPYEITDELTGAPLGIDGNDRISSIDGQLIFNYILNRGLGEEVMQPLLKTIFDSQPSETQGAQNRTGESLFTALNDKLAQYDIDGNGQVSSIDGQFIFSYILNRGLGEGVVQPLLQNIFESQPSETGGAQNTTGAEFFSVVNNLI